MSFRDVIRKLCYSSKVVITMVTTDSHRQFAKRTPVIIVYLANMKAACYIVLLFVSDWTERPASVRMSWHRCCRYSWWSDAANTNTWRQHQSPLGRRCHSCGRSGWLTSYRHSLLLASVERRRKRCLHVGLWMHGMMARGGGGGWHHVWLFIRRKRRQSAATTTMRKHRVTKTGTRVGHCEFKQLFTLLLPSVSKLFWQNTAFKATPQLCRRHHQITHSIL